MNDDAESSTPAPRKPEILAPAGSEEALSVALAAGADAIYFGLAAGFNARARAANFDATNLRATVARIHRAGARAYLTLNTLIFEPELEAVQVAVRSAAAAGVDALIIQDPAVALMAQSICPELELHASTQMTVADGDAAAFARALGVTRVVVPRELSIAEIGIFAATSKLEVEVFVHGALCVSWSGQCLTSEAWGGRSANRGECAQSCRMPYDLLLDGVPRDLGEIRYLLSPKDLAGMRAVPELMRLGVHGLKIEGRQKGPAYVATAVAGYRTLVDDLGSGVEDPERVAVRAEQALGDMALAYTRGFSDGFLAGSDHQTLVEGRFPKHRGHCLGRVSALNGKRITIAPAEDARPWTGGRAATPRPMSPDGGVASPLPGFGGASDAASGPATLIPGVRPGMGVVFDQGHPEDQNEPGGPIFAVDHDRGRVVLTFGNPGPDLTRVRIGDRVWITSDPEITKRTTALLASGEPEGRLPVRLRVSGAIGEPLRVTAEAACGSATASSSMMLTAARDRGLDAPLLKEKLGALGGTAFHVQAFDLTALLPGLHLPVSELKVLRRALADALQNSLDRPPERTLRDVATVDLLKSRAVQRARPGSVTDHPQVVPLCRTSAQLDAALAAGVAEVELDWMELTGLRAAVIRARAAGVRVCVATLRVQKPGETFDDTLFGLDADALLIRHLGGLVRATTPTLRHAGRALHGDFSLNVTNSITARHFLAAGLDTVTASHDLDESQLLALARNTPAGRLAVVVFHRIATFHTEHCVYAHLLSAGRDHRTCGRPCESHEVGLRDHLGRTHPVIVDAGCRNTIFNSEQQAACALVPELRSIGVRRFRVEFARESPAEVAHVIGIMGRLVRGEIAPAAAVEALGVRDHFGVAAGRMHLMV